MDSDGFWWILVDFDGFWEAEGEEFQRTKKQIVILEHPPAPQGTPPLAPPPAPAPSVPVGTLWTLFLPP